MRLQDKLTEIIARQCGMISAKQIAGSGVSRQMVQHYLREGLLSRVAQGLYVTPDGIVDDLFVLAMKVPTGVFSHGTALFLNGLTDRTPFEPALTIDKDKVLTASLRSVVKCFYVQEDVLKLGLVRLKTPLGNEVTAYDPERTVCDLIRSRARLDDELVLDGLRQYAAQRNKNIERLGEYARILGVVDDVRRTMEVVL